jgi:hypothetical protein
MFPSHRKDGSTAKSRTRNLADAPATELLHERTQNIGCIRHAAQSLRMKVTFMLTR